MKSLAIPALETVPLSESASIAMRSFDLPAFAHGWHRHPEVELTWIVAGSGLRYVGDSVEPFGPGDFCLLGAHVPHAWLSAKNPEPARARSYVVQFDPGVLGESFLRLPELARISRLLAQAAHGLRFDTRLGADLRRRLQAGATPLSRLTALLEILQALADGPAPQPLSLAPWTEDRRLDADPRFRRVLTHLVAHSHESVSQAALARMMGLSPAGFSRFFRRAMGRTFQAYLTDLRLGLACRQLLTTDRTVSEIAYASGFGNLSNFNRAFRQRRSITPRDFRRRSLGDD